MTNLITEIESWLAQTIPDDTQSIVRDGTELVQEIKQAIAQNPSDAKRLGAFIGQISARQKSIASLEPDTWVPIGDGALAIGHRPSAKKMTDLQLQGCSHVVTLLSESEGAKDVQKAVERKRMTWLWLPLTSGDPPDAYLTEEVCSLFLKLDSAFSARARAYLHCSAGIHRTGMISYAYLRHRRMKQQAALETLGELRPVTSENVGDHRIDWGNQFFSH